MKEQNKVQPGTFKRLAGYFKPNIYALMAVFLTAILSALFNILGPKLMGKATTKLFEGLLLKFKHIPGAQIDFASIFRIVLLLALLYLFSSLFSYVQQWVMSRVAQDVVCRMRNEVQGKLSRLPLKFFDAHTHGELLSRVLNDIDNISSTLQQSLTQLITALCMLVGIVIMMVTISPLLTLIVLITLPLSFVVTARIARRSQQLFARQQKELGELNGHVEEIFTGHILVKAFGQERQAREKFAEINERLYQSGWKAQFVSGIIQPALSLITNFGYVFVCVAGGILVAKQKIEIGDVQAFIQYSRQFNWPITQTANIANIIQSTLASAARVFEILDETEELPDSQEARALPSPRGEVAFHHVQFSYADDNPLIQDMNIHVRPGQTVAIVGPTGAGKTTLVNLLLRFYEISGGSITIDGVDIRQLKRGELRSLFGMVLQDTWLFHGTIRDNIAYGREGATDEEVIRAAQMAHADHFIRTLPDGYQTLVNEEASNISQGQKQLLTIARALLADPPILILDEATSNVDTRTELLIQKAMNTLMKGRTSFVIAHRLSTIRDADWILVMNQGQLVEQGTHRELLAKGGFYADLYNSQFVLPAS